jgi:hypothetical protein
MQVLYTSAVISRVRNLHASLRRHLVSLACKCYNYIQVLALVYKTCKMSIQTCIQVQNPTNFMQILAVEYKSCMQIWTYLRIKNCTKKSNFFCHFHIERESTALYSSTPNIFLINFQLNLYCCPIKSRNNDDDLVYPTSTH